MVMVMVVVMVVMLMVVVVVKVVPLVETNIDVNHTRMIVRDSTATSTNSPPQTGTAAL